MKNKSQKLRKKEKKISDWLVKVANDRNLEVYQDSALNVVIKKAGSKGYEDYYKEGDFVVLRSKTVVEYLVVDGITYSFVQPLDIICEIK